MFHSIRASLTRTPRSRFPENQFIDIVTIPIFYVGYDDNPKKIMVLICHLVCAIYISVPVPTPIAKQSRRMEFLAPHIRLKIVNCRPY